MHALLHIPYDIHQNGPIWLHWLFVMERFCGQLISQVKSRRYPYQQLANRIVFRSQLSHIAMTHGIEDLINPSSHNYKPSSNECTYPECKLTFSLPLTRVA